MRRRGRGGVAVPISYIKPHTDKLAYLEIIGIPRLKIQLNIPAMRGSDVHIRRQPLLHDLPVRV